MRISNFLVFIERVSPIIGIKISPLGDEITFALLLPFSTFANDL